MNRQQISPGIFKVELKRRKNGRQEIVYEVLVDGPRVNGKRGKRIRTRCKEGDKSQPLSTYSAAKNERARILHEVATSRFVQRRKTTVDEACEAWLEGKHGLKDSTRHGYKTWFSALRQELGDIELQQLTKDDLDGLIRRLRAGEVEGHKVWKPTSINKLMGRFNAVMEDARKQGHVYRNVVELIDRLPQEKATFDILSEEQMFKILGATTEMQHFWVLSLYGLRASEAVGLRWENVDFDNRTLSVFETRVTAGKNTFVGTPKTKASRRTLPMPDEVYDFLKAAYGRVESDYVICGRNGDPLTTNALSSRWGHMLRRLDIPHVRLHDARHSCASLMYARGVNDAIISAWLGHASVAVTRSIYVHARPEALNEAAVSFGRASA